MLADKAMQLFVAVLVLTAKLAAGLDNGLALTPTQGFNTWNYFGCDINETVIKQTADKLVELGLVKAGYTYLNIDDCWHSHTRDQEGKLQPDPEKFPSGMKAVGDYLHSLGLKFGIYSDAGLFTCAGYPGSRGHEGVDASSWASWGVDYLKYDNCFAASEDVVERYQAMREALNATGRPIIYSLCEWGVADPWRWAPSVGNSWRTDADISASWDAVLRSLDNGVVGLAQWAAPGGWNDPDMLEVGNGELAITQQRAHFALWALAKAPLLIGTDLRRVSEESLNILKAEEVIGLNQDPLGVAGDLIWKEGPLEVYAAPLKGGGRGVVLFNRHLVGPPARISLPWALIGYPAGLAVRVRDCYLREDLGEFKDEFAARLNNGDVAVVTLTPTEPSAAYESWRPWGQGPAPAPSLQTRGTAGGDGSASVDAQAAAGLLPIAAASALWGGQVENSSSSRSQRWEASQESVGLLSFWRAWLGIRRMGSGWKVAATRGPPIMVEERIAAPSRLQELLAAPRACTKALWGAGLGPGQAGTVAAAKAGLAGAEEAEQPAWASGAAEAREMRHRQQRRQRERRHPGRRSAARHGSGKVASGGLPVV